MAPRTRYRRSRRGFRRRGRFYRRRIKRPIGSGEFGRRFFKLKQLVPLTQLETPASELWTLLTDDLLLLRIGLRFLLYLISIGSVLSRLNGFPV
jgi:hypothetical protein